MDSFMVIYVIFKIESFSIMLKNTMNMYLRKAWKIWNDKGIMFMWQITI